MGVWGHGHHGLLFMQYQVGASAPPHQNVSPSSATGDTAKKYSSA